MRLITFSVRNTKEIVRDPLTICFSLGFPLVVLFLLYAISAHAPLELFEMKNLAPGITIFGLSFMTLFSATLVSKDRETALLQRLYTTPLTAVDFILGYLLPIIPISVLQAIITFGVSLFLGLKFSIGLLWGVLFIIPISLFFIGMGLIFGSILSVKAVGGVSGALFTNVAAWLSGIWFDLDMVGGAFKAIGNALPFVHAVEIERAVVNLNFTNIGVHLIYVLAWAAFALILAIVLFLRQMKRQ